MTVVFHSWTLTQLMNNLFTDHYLITKCILYQEPSSGSVERRESLRPLTIIDFHYSVHSPLVNNECTPLLACPLQSRVSQT